MHKLAGELGTPFHNYNDNGTETLRKSGTNALLFIPTRISVIGSNFSDEEIESFLWSWDTMKDKSSNTSAGNIKLCDLQFMKFESVLSFEENHTFAKLSYKYKITVFIYPMSARYTYPTATIFPSFNWTSRTILIFPASSSWIP